jgi:DNA-binding transcriptional LysR family regulator
LSNERYAELSFAKSITAMELRQLQHFVAIAEEQSFTKAAARLGYVQSALSVSVQSLERELGVRLLDRTTHRVRLSDEGEMLLPTARAALAAAQEVRDQAAAAGGVLRGALRIGIMQSFAFLDMPALLGRFHREHPHVEIVMRPAAGGSAALLDAIADGELDVAFVGMDQLPSNIATVPLGSEELFLTAVPGIGPQGEGPVRLEQLASETLVDFPGGWGIRSAIDRAFAAAGLRRRVSIEVADVNLCLQLVREGLGAAVLPRSLLTEADTQLVIRLLEPRLYWHVVVALPSKRPPGAAAAAFIELIPRGLLNPEGPQI